MATIGVIGAGAFARYTLDAYKKYLPNLELGAIASRTRSRAEQVAADFSIPRIKPDNETLLDDPDIDVVLIMTPPATHFELVRLALTKGKHVLVDKPVAFTVEQVDELVKVARAQQLEMSTNLVLRTHTSHRELKDMCERGNLGRLRQIISTGLLARYPKDHWYWDETVSGGFYLNTFSHFLDLFDYITDETPEHMAANGNPSAGYLLCCSYPSGIQASLAVSLQVSNANEQVNTRYIFEHGVVETDGWLPHRLTIRAEHEPEEVLESCNKDEEYQQCLAEIMSDLLMRIENPTQASEVGITLDVIRSSVVAPLAFAAHPMFS